MKKPSKRNKIEERKPSYSARKPASQRRKPRADRSDKHSFRRDRKKTGGGYARNKKQSERSRRKPKGKA